MDSDAAHDAISSLPLLSDRLAVTLLASKCDHIWLVPIYTTRRLVKKGTSVLMTCLRLL